MMHSLGVSNRPVRTLSGKLAVFAILLLATAPHFSSYAGPAPILNDYRSKAAGNLDNPAIWEQLTASGWVSAGNAPGATQSTVFIYHAVAGNTATFPARFTVGAGGVFTALTPGVISTALVVENGGLLQINSQLGFGASASFSVENGGTVAVNAAYPDPETSLWNGTENFSPASTFKFQNWNLAVPVLTNDAAFSTTTSNGLSAVFGNLVLEFGTTQMAGLQVMSAAFSKNLAYGNLEIVSASAGSSIRLGGSGSTIYGNLQVGPGMAGSSVYLATTQLTIGGSFVQQGGTTYASAANGTTATATIKGNITVSAGTFDLLPLAATSGSGAALNLHGNLEVASTALLTVTNTAAADAAIALFNFSGNSPQTVKAYSQVANIPFRVAAGATVVLGANLKVNRSTVATILQTGSSLDFSGFNFEGTSGFQQLAGATLRITSPNGINTSGTLGNVLSSATGRKFNSEGIYHYAGTTAQVTGTGLNAAAGQKTIIIDNPTSVTFSAKVNISTTGGMVDIRQGKLEETATGFLAVSNSSNSVQLKMAANTLYRSAALSSSLSATHLSFPQVAGVWTLDLASTIELAGAGAQVLRSTNTVSGATPKYYSHIIFSGSGTKTLSNNVPNVRGIITIQGSAVVDAEDKPLGNEQTGFSMTGGRYRTKRSDVQPTMAGEYNLSGGVVEFYGTAATGATQTVRGGKTYYSIEITAAAANTTTYNVLNGAGMVTVAGEFRVKAPAVYQIGGSNNYIVGATASDGAFILEAGATLKYGDKNGITAASCGTTSACGNIRTPQRQFSGLAGYGFVGSSAGMVSGSGLPAEVASLYLDRAANSLMVTLTNPLTIANALVFRNGKLKTTDAAMLTFGNNATHQGASELSYISGPITRTGSAAFTFPIGDDTYFAPAAISATATDNTFYVRYANQDPVSALTPGVRDTFADSINHISNREYWRIDRLAGTSFPEVELTWSEERSGIVTDPEALLIARLGAGAYWENEGANNVVSDYPDGSITTAQPVSETGYFTLGSSSSDKFTNPLPVELLFFSAQLQGRQVEIDWATASEKDNAYFDVERSADGQLFTSIGRVASNGNTDFRQDYRLTDAAPLPGLAYYRLRQTDLDGTTVFSALVAVRHQNEPAQLALFPNPVSERAVIQLDSEIAREVSLRIITVEGRVLETGKYLLQSGANLVGLPVNKLVPALYLLELQSDTGRQTLRFEKI